MSDNTDDVRRAMEDFVRALNTLFTGDVAPMTEVWSHADDVTYMGPQGGVQVGWTAVLADWERQAAMRLGGAVAPTDMQIVAGSDLATVISVVAGRNTNASGSERDVYIRSTNTFRKESGAWKMVGTHVDPLRFIQG